MTPTSLVNIGKITGTHGYKGTMKVELLTDYPERFKGMKSIQVQRHKEILSFPIESSQMNGPLLLLKLKGIESKEEAQLYRGAFLCVSEDEVFPLPEGSYYHFQLIGLDVVDEKRGLLGKLTDVLETGANDVYVVNSPEFGEILLPAIKQVILGVDLEKGQMQVCLLEGLIEED